MDLFYHIWSWSVTLTFQLASLHIYSLWWTFVSYYIPVTNKCFVDRTSCFYRIWHWTFISTPDYLGQVILINCNYRRSTSDGPGKLFLSCLTSKCVIELDLATPYSLHIASWWLLFVPSYSKFQQIMKKLWNGQDVLSHLTMTFDLAMTYGFGALHRGNAHAYQISIHLSFRLQSYVPDKPTARPPLVTT